MLQAMVAKKVIEMILKRVMEKRAIKNMRKYVEEENELDVQMKQLQKTVAKQGKYIEELEKNVAILSKDSHPPVFKKKEYKDILKRLKNLEKGE
jgi:chromosome segregation and condensation protein ScpB